MNDKADKLGRLQRWTAEQDAKAEKARELPRATCRWCGGTARAGEGTRAAAPLVGVAFNVHGERVFYPATPAPADADDWRRECATCATATVGELLSGLLREPVTDEDAHAVTARMFWRDANGIEHDEIAWARVVGHGTGRRFGHVTDDHRAHVRDILRQVREERLPAPSAWGACGWCGVRYSHSWHEGPPTMRWTDGTPAPLCDTCHEIWEQKAAPDDIDQLRILGVIAATGSHAYVWSHAPEPFRLYFETKDADGNGHEDPWDYGDGIRAFRDQVWTDRPDLAPADQRAHYRERYATAQAEQNAAHHAKQEAKLATIW